ncbi:MAG: FAD-binding protein [Pseudomonadales bacterium]|nr:FAD-binding protein [Pseudomonadales bacterium]
MSEQTAIDVDFVIVGSGGGALAAAIRAHDLGLNTLVVEKSAVYGGSTAMSGGGVWIPNNHLMAAAGVEDSDTEAFAYLKHITKDQVAYNRLRAYVEHGKRAIEYLEKKAGLRLRSLPKYIDYYPDAPGAKPGGRTLEPRRFNTLKLGKERKKLRASHPQTLSMGYLHMTALEAYWAVRGGFPGRLPIIWRLVLHWLNLPARLIDRRSLQVTLGNAVIAPLRHAMLERNIPLWLNTAARSLVINNMHVSGIVAERDGQEVTINSKHGVLLACGGFDHNQQMREQYLPMPNRHEWCAGNPDNTGDGILMGQATGARLELMDDAWWTPVTRVPGEDLAWILVYEKNMPHSCMLNTKGERITNEAGPYIDVVNDMYFSSNRQERKFPHWMILDSRFRQQFAIGHVLPSGMMPDKKVPEAYWDNYLYKADTLEALCKKTGIDVERATQSIERFNQFCETGQDKDFGRGQSEHDHYYSPKTDSPNPNLGSIKEAPFYAIPLYPGDLGTKGGLLTNEKAQVLRGDDSVIEGLYACGNCSSAVMGNSYAGAGSTIGPSIVFGFIAAESAASASGKANSST